MNKKDDNSSAEELVQSFLKKNKNFFIKHPELLKELQFPLKDGRSEKVIDLQVYRYKKINQENIDNAINQDVFCLDINSGVEFAPGKKDISLIKEIVHKVRA